MGVLTAAVIVLVSVEVGYFIRMTVWMIGSKLRSSINPLDSSRIYGIVTTRDVDFMLNHLNNSRYLRAMDFGRLEHMSRSTLGSTLLRSKSSAVVGSSVIRYRRPVYIFMPYCIHSEIAYWDDKSIYYRQDIRTVHDNFLRSTAYLQVTLIGCSPVELLLKSLEVCKKRPVCLPSSTETTTPSESLDSFLTLKPLPSDLKKFIGFNEESSLRLKAEKLVQGTIANAVDSIEKRTKNQ